MSSDFGSDFRLLNGEMGNDISPLMNVGIQTLSKPLQNYLATVPSLQTASSAVSNVSTVAQAIVANPLWENYKVPICLTLGIIIGKISIKGAIAAVILYTLINKK